MNMQGFAIKLTTALALLLAAIGVVQAAGVDDGFNPDANGTVWVVEQQRNGQVLLGGSFTTIGGSTRNRLARVNNDGSRSGFNPDVGGGDTPTVLALHEQPDGDILIGGLFTTVAGQPRSSIARVNSAGTLDPGFNPGTDGVVYAFASQLSADGLSGSIYVGGAFDSVGGMSRHGVARLHANGSIDTSFDPPEFNGLIYAVRMQLDGRVVVAGSFTTIDGAVVSPKVARLNADGSLDSTFVAPALSNGSIRDLVVQTDGKILIAGSFSSVGGQPRNRIARLHSDGQLDSGFVPPAFNNSIIKIVLQADGRITVAGTFDNFLFRSGMARLQANGSYDTGFNQGVLGDVYAVAQQADGKYAIGGVFNQIGNYTRNNIARLDASGAPDVDFVADLNGGPVGTMYALATQTDGRVLVGGLASGANSGLTRLLGNGVPDSSFTRFLDDTVYTVIAQPDGKILVGGEFDNIGPYVTRLLSNGSVDNTFNANVSGGVFASALQPDGRALIGGIFTGVGGLSQPYLARLLINGAADTGFRPSLNGLIFAVTIQPDGKILIGGSFTLVNGQSSPYLARLNSDGTLDAGFESDVDGVVRAIATDASGRILIGGEFSTVDSVARRAIARLNPDGHRDTTFAGEAYSVGTTVLTVASMSYGGILIGGYSVQGGTLSGFVDRLFEGGGQDVGVNPDIGEDSLVTSLHVQSDGKVLFGGGFQNVDGKPRNKVARFAQLGPAVQSLDFVNATDLRWSRTRNSPELIAAPLVLWSSSCCDSASFQLLPNGSMTRVGNEWRLQGINSIGGGGTRWLRAISIAGDGGKSAGTIESPILKVRSPETGDRIFTNSFD